jgi:peptide/nickel transport system substrate-binding protein
MRFRLAATASALAVALLAAGCGSTSPAPQSHSTATIQSFAIGTSFPEPNLDPTKNGFAWAIIGLSLETLLKLSPQGQLEPYLAKSMTHPSATTYVFHLRQGIKFWDGSPLTAADVAYSLDYERSPSSQASDTFSTVKNVVATGPDTVVVTMLQPDPSFLYGLTNSGYIFEKKFAEEHKGKFGDPGVLFVGTGPWEVRSLDPTTGAQLSANPHWWGGRVPIRNISFKFFSNDTSAALAFRAGEIDLDPFLDGPKSFAATSGANILAAPSDCTNAQLSMNTQVAPWNDIHVRQAVAYALNRQDIIVAEGGYAQPYYTFIPTQMLDEVGTAAQVTALTKSLPLYQYNLAKAKQEMAESAYPHGFTAQLVVFVYGNVVDTAQVISAELQKIGINLQVKAVTLAAWGTDVSTTPPSKRPATYFTSGCSTPDVSGYDWLLGSQNLVNGEYNTADWAPSNVNALLNQGLAAPTAAQRFAIYSELSRTIAAQVPYVPLFLHDNAIALSSKFAFDGYSQYAMQDSGPYALNIRPSS